MRHRFVVVGGGIVGLSTALALSRRFPRGGILVLEKEAGWGRHQTGRNSGVIHSGIYYAPGSLKARFALAGARSLAAFCRAHDIPHDVCGKVIVATDTRELPRLDALYRRGLAHGLAVRMLGPTALRELEPHAAGVAAIHVPEAGIVDFRLVAAAMAELLNGLGADLRLRAEVRRIHEGRHGVVVETEGETFRAEFLVNCAGLHSDRVARLAGVAAGVRIVPFRGEYYDLRPERRGLVRHLIYPVPNPSFPFLGVHLTRTIHGPVHAGPNAVLGLDREGYRRTDVRLRDAADTLVYAGFWRLVRRHGGDGLRELVRSISKRAFVRSVQRLVPEIVADDLVPGGTGIRAQALGPDGALADDFLILAGRRSVHVCNAPSPAATASIEIGKAVAERAVHVQQAVLV